MKTLVAITFCLMVGGMLITAGCSKREQALGTTSVVSGAAGAASFLKAHFKRGGERKRQLTCAMYHPKSNIRMFDK